MYEKGYPFEIIEDIGSGINYKKKGLKELLSKINHHEISKWVILYKDSLVRFGFCADVETLQYPTTFFSDLLWFRNLSSCSVEISLSDKWCWAWSDWQHRIQQRTGINRRPDSDNDCIWKQALWSKVKENKEMDWWVLSFRIYYDSGICQVVP